MKKQAGTLDSAPGLCYNADNVSFEGGLTRICASNRFVNPIKGRETPSEDGLFAVAVCVLFASGSPFVVPK